jgi:hypothetical protein
MNAEPKVQVLDTDAFLEIFKDSRSRGMLNSLPAAEQADILAIAADMLQQRWQETGSEDDLNQ